MRIYRCDICGGIINNSVDVVRIKHWFTKSDICGGCWMEIKTLRRLERKNQKAREEQKHGYTERD